ncbi:hypothetical protein CASFOL_027306 [Castilleja foliolosa]|uniref:NAC domain-containing protein n=1 Tax=Castilleja foliolosa TaxID=1961234 RepID=A0ABD3CEF5_9LAMI
MDKELLPTGYRFYPTEEELVSFYLQNKLNNTGPDIHSVIPLLHIYDYTPSDLPKLGGEYCPEDGEQWFFFIPRQEKEARGGRPNRLTARGYWKATGSPGDVYSSLNHQVIGRKRSMGFYVGRAPYGNKTVWKMIEYKAISQSDHETSTTTIQLREELSLCRIYKSSKWLREFDRRPVPSEAVIGDQAVVHHQAMAATCNINQHINTYVPAVWDYNWDELNQFDICKRE